MTFKQTALVALIAAGSTLAGVWLGGYQQAKVQQAQREFDRQTRFHEVRAEAYTKLVGDFAQSYANWTEVLPDDHDLSRSFGTIDILGAVDVGAAAVEVMCAVGRSRHRPPSREEVLKYRATTRHFVDLARKELGIPGSYAESVPVAGECQAILP